ncbi:SMP-30/gluconolactonase/LRE family protein [Tamlana sp. 2_MG-2023]|uniref:SMP-30/gluconolactonase/LRE family protein n=1 Tax=unclassified Tamlana TaxID=2614803 RepID=UPI0026E4720E|nr:MULTISPECIES: SMP-30/gluconolactonase/LRE family protein [unclassified Tamlana]MDO6761212.1 SMP-30/gluconolactonase/LRE family protein [Tamlana sp. 2_MG-2023]MDO6791695.1 SMP-30/gluconolactonase/LRE family protein [Tamlana sp. 1_MG-2023]
MRKIQSILFIVCITLTCSAQDNMLLTAKLFTELPDSCPTPDAFDVAPDGSLTLSCPNYADKTKPGVLMRISKDGTVTKLVETPVLAASGMSKPMGIAYDDEGVLYVCDNQTNKGRILRMTFNGNKLMSTEIVAYGFYSINGIRYHKGHVYITQTNLPKLKTDKVVGAVYRFKTTDRDIKVNNDTKDTNLIYTSTTQNTNRQVGLDGLVFNKKGDLFVGNLGDATIYKLTLNADGKVENESVYVKLPINSAPDGINIDAEGNLYVAGFSQNQIFKIDTNQNVKLLAQYPDNNGADGGLDQPADVIVYNGKLIISNFDLMVAKGMKNSKHGKPYTISFIDLKE